PLAGALVVDKEEPKLRFFADRPTQAAAEDILFHRRSILSGPVQEEFVCIQYIVPEKLVGVTVESPGTRFQNGVDVAAAVAALARVVKRSLNFKFLNNVGIWEWDIGGLRHIVVRRTDAFDQVVVVVLALTVDDHTSVAASE